MVAAFIAFMIYDYVSYHSRYTSAMTVVSRLDGRAGSLLDWPFGRECRITFDRPLSAEELGELAVLNSLSGRHWIGVAFDCEMEASQILAARDALSGCVVFEMSSD